MAEHLLRSLLVLTLLLGVTACKQLTPEEQFDLNRGAYTVELSGAPGLREVEIPLEPEVMDADEQAAAQAAGEDEENTMPRFTLRQDALLDLLVSTEGEEALPGITVDIFHYGSTSRRRGTSGVTSIRQT